MDLWYFGLERFFFPPGLRIFQHLSPILAILRYSLYDFLHENLELVQYGFPLSLQPVVWGAASGALTGLLTNPPDLILSVLLTDQDTNHKHTGHEDEAWLKWSRHGFMFFCCGNGDALFQASDG